MSSNTKKWINRGGLLAVVVGIALVVIGGGDPDAALESAGTMATIVGAALVFVRELLS